MIFGYDPHEAEEMLNELSDTARIYLDVIAVQTKNGQILPLRFMWTNGQGYNIEKIINIRKGNSLKIYAPGYRYLCQTGKHRFYLYFDGKRWYTERRINC